MPFMHPRLGAGFVVATMSVLMASTALAADFSPETRINAVTVYPAGAEVIRDVPVDLPAGGHRLIIGGLPDGIDAKDVRAEGLVDGDLVIQSVDVARVPVTGDPVQDSSLRRERERLADDKALLEGEIRTAELQRKMLMALVRPSAPAGDGRAGMDALSPDQMFDFVANRHGSIEVRIHQAKREIRDIDRRIAEIDRELSRGERAQAWQSRVTVSVDAARAVQGGLKLRYRLAEATWQPIYDARLDTRSQADGLVLVQRAMVRQWTGEDWRGVSLSLGTARPHAGTAAPEVRVGHVEFTRPRPEPRHRLHGMDRMAAEAPAPAQDKAMDEEAAVVTDLGFDALYTVPGLAHVPSTGDVRTVLIADHAVTPALEARIVPAQRAAAFLTARYTYDGAAPLPAGPVRLFRDGVYVGEGRLPLSNAGQDTELGFGLDERIAVTRTLVADRKGADGIFSRSRTDTRDWRTTIANHHRVPIDIVVLDSLPQAGDEAITVTPLATNDPADETNVGNRPGVLAWRFALEAGGERTLSFGYRIDWPEGRQVIVGMR